ncbi:MAG: nuclear transport factor 2 family protein [Deltaproteobacteria bacterium]|nr:nuclear transport factor 2 family protein [Deltaproteobacteria bacterium]
MSKPREPASPVTPSPNAEVDPARADFGTSLTKELTRVEEANLGFYEAFMSRDLEKMSRLWAHTPHVRCVHPGWELVVGWDDVRASWQEILRSVQAVEFQLEDIHVEVSGRTAWVNLIAYVHIETEDGEDFQATVVTTNILEQMDGEWRFVLHHSSNFSDESEEDEDEDEDMDFETNGPGSMGDPN